VNFDDPADTHIERTYGEGSAALRAAEPDLQPFIQRLPAAAKVLDCGCGPGMDTERFVRLGFAVVAINLSDRFVQVTTQRVPRQ
jgi:2-polyprenyl-3-methyl-5-hydroxy-6-metoxy-1,4-benzoquinol methylase